MDHKMRPSHIKGRLVAYFDGPGMIAKNEERNSSAVRFPRFPKQPRKLPIPKPSSLSQEPLSKKVYIQAITINRIHAFVFLENLKANL